MSLGTTELQSQRGIDSLLWLEAMMWPHPALSWILSSWRYWLEAGPSELTATEVSQANHAMLAFVRSLETTYLHFQEGLIPEGALIGYGMRAPALAGLRFRTEFWPELRGEFDPDFVRFAEPMWGMS